MAERETFFGQITIAPQRERAPFRAPPSPPARTQTTQPEKETMKPIDAVLATRPDLTPSQRAYLREKPLADVVEMLPLIPVNAAATTTRPVAGAGAIRAARSSPSEAKSIAERFHRDTEERTVHWSGASLVFPQLTSDAANKILARHRSAGPLPRGATLDPQTVMAAVRAMKPGVHE
jgi:hypothetical protein